MGRTKQIARKSTNGKAPRRQLATRARDAVIESQNDESPRDELDDPFFEFVEQTGRTHQIARKSTGGKAPRKQLATRARRAVIPPELPAESDDDGSLESEEEEVDSGIVQTGRTFQTARKSTGGAMPRRQLATKARRAVIPGHVIHDQSFDSDFDNEPPVKQQKLEAKVPPKPKPFNFTEGQIVVIDEKTDEETRVKYLGGASRKKRPNRLIEFINQKWSKVEDGYCVLRSTEKCSVAKIKLEYLLGMKLSDIARKTINQQIEADKEPAAPEPAAVEPATVEPAAQEPACEQPAREEPDQEEFEVLEFLGPEINVPEEKIDNNEDSSNIEAKAFAQKNEETNTSSEEKKSDRPDVIIID